MGYFIDATLVESADPKGKLMSEVCMLVMIVCDIIPRRKGFAKKNLLAYANMLFPDLL